MCLYNNIKDASQSAADYALCSSLDPPFLWSFLCKISLINVSRERVCDATYVKDKMATALRSKVLMSASRSFQKSLKSDSKSETFL